MQYIENPTDGFYVSCNNCCGHWCQKWQASSNTVRPESCCALIKRRSSIAKRTVSENWIKQLHALLALHFNHCLATEYSETTAHVNGNFDTDSQIYVTQPKCTKTFRAHFILLTIAERKLLHFFKFWSFLQVTKHKVDWFQLETWFCEDSFGDFRHFIDCTWNTSNIVIKVSNNV
jgi:hypothetical protein